MVIYGRTAANVYVAAKLATNSTIGICVKDGVRCAMQRNLYNMIGTVANVHVVAKLGMTVMYGTVASVPVAVIRETNNTIGTVVNVQSAVKNSMTGAVTRTVTNVTVAVIK